MERAVEDKSPRGPYRHALARRPPRKARPFLFIKLLTKAPWRGMAIRDRTARAVADDGELHSLAVVIKMNCTFLRPCSQPWTMARTSLLFAHAGRERLTPPPLPVLLDQERRRHPATTVPYALPRAEPSIPSYRPITDKIHFLPSYRPSLSCLYLPYLLSYVVLRVASF